MSRLSTELCGLTLKNPVLVASAPTTGTAEHVRKALEAGAAGVVMKSVTDDPSLRISVRPMFAMLQREGYPHNFSNYSMGFASGLSVDQWLRELKRAREYAENHDAVVGGSIFSGRTLQSWVDMARWIEDTGADFLELDFSCPNTRGSGSGIDAFTNAEAYAELVSTISPQVAFPIFPKLSPESDPVLTAAKVKQAGASGVTVMNRISALEIDLKTGRPLLAGGFTGVGGPWMRPILLKFIARIAMEVGMPIMATNGIWAWQDVAKAIMCGAGAVQVCTAILFSGKGYRVISSMLRQLDDYIAENWGGSIAAVHGITLPQVRSFTTLERRQKSEVWAELNAERCNGCRACYHSCVYNAVELLPDKTLAVCREKCEGCGLCRAICPQGAITMAGAGPLYLDD